MSDFWSYIIYAIKCVLNMFAAGMGRGEVIRTESEDIVVGTLTLLFLAFSFFLIFDFKNTTKRLKKRIIKLSRTNLIAKFIALLWFLSCIVLFVAFFISKSEVIAGISIVFLLTAPFIIFLPEITGVKEPDSN